MRFSTTRASILIFDHYLRPNVFYDADDIPLSHVINCLEKAGDSYKASSPVSFLYSINATDVPVCGRSYNVLKSMEYFHVTRVVDIFSCKKHHISGYKVSRCSTQTDTNYPVVTYSTDIA